MAKPFISKYYGDQVRIWRLVLNFLVQDAREFWLRSEEQDKEKRLFITKTTGIFQRQGR
jgi:hypothetical protein